MMKYMFIISIFCCSLMAQAQAEPSQDELLKELHEKMNKASQEMDKLEKELAKIAKDRPHPDVVAARIKKMREDMRAGKLDDLDDGIIAYLKKHPELIDLNNLTDDEIKSILNDNKELLKKIANDDNIIDEIIKLQLEADKNLEKVLDSSNNASTKTDDAVDESIKIIHKLSENSKSSGNNVENKDNKDNKEKSKESKEQQESDQKQKAGGPEHQTQTENPDDGNSVARAQNSNDETFQMSKKSDAIGGANSNNGDNREPAKYKGFLGEFYKSLHKRYKSK